MSLQCKFFVIPIRDIEEIEKEINQFLRTVRVINIQREFVSQGENSFWSMIVEYQTESKGYLQTTGKKKTIIDYREVLSPEDFAVYAKLRDWRKEVANKEGSPVYTVFTNEQIAKIVRAGITSKAELRKIDGIGESRTEKYGEDVILIMSRETGTETQKNRTDQNPPAGNKKKKNESQSGRQKKKNETDRESLLPNFDV